MAEVGRTAPEKPEEGSATVKSVGTKRAAPEQGSSGRPMKKSWVRSKM
jgi:hypothetical protein